MSDFVNEANAISNIVMAGIYMLLTAYATYCLVMNLREGQKTVMSRRFPLLVMIGSAFRALYFGIPNSILHLHETPQNYDKGSTSWWMNILHVQLQSVADVVFLYLFGFIIVCTARAYLCSFRPELERRPLVVFRWMTVLYVVVKVSLLVVLVASTFAVALIIHSTCSSLLCLAAAAAFVYFSCRFRYHVFNPALKSKPKVDYSAHEQQLLPTGARAAHSLSDSLEEELSEEEDDPPQRDAHPTSSNYGSLNRVSETRDLESGTPTTTQDASSESTHGRRMSEKSGGSNRTPLLRSDLSAALANEKMIDALSGAACRLTFVGFVCTICLLFRAGCLLYQLGLVIADPHSMSNFPRNVWWAIVGAYYIFNDVVSCSVVLTVLRQAAKKSVSKGNAL